MEKEKINIAELLRNCPKGMELYSPIFGNVYLDKIRPHLAIIVTTDKEQGDFKEEFLYDGRYGMNGECMLFPSKGKTTWEGFIPPCQFKDGDVISVIVNKNLWYGIYQKEFNAVLYCYVDYSTATESIYLLDKNGMCLINDISEIRLATEDEKQKLFQVIKDNGYKWNPETKALEELVEPKFKIEKGKWYVCIKDLLDNYANKAFHKGDTYYSPEDGYLIPGNSNVPSKVEYYIDEYFRDWTIQDAKDGDVLIDKVYHGEFPFLFKEAKSSDIKTDYLNPLTILGYCGIGKVGFTKGEGWGDTANCTYYPAAKEQRDFLFQKIKEAGYKWNLETKTLEKLPMFKVGDRIQWHGTHINYPIRVVKSLEGDRYRLDNGNYIKFGNEHAYKLLKFDITTLKPFDKVLVRKDDKKRWGIQFFERLNNVLKDTFVCMNGHRYHQCIPYEGNEHLLNTSNEPVDFYKTWENQQD